MALPLVLRDDCPAGAQSGDLSLDLDMGDASWFSPVYERLLPLDE